MWRAEDLSALTFFVISGFLISVAFYRGRIRRILPAPIIVLAATWAIGWFALGPDESLAPGRQISAAAVFASNLVLMHDSGYFAPSADVNPFLHLRPLSIEKQFYLV